MSQDFIQGIYYVFVQHLYNLLYLYNANITFGCAEVGHIFIYFFKISSYSQ